MRLIALSLALLCVPSPGFARAAETATPSTRPEGILPPSLVKRFNHWGFAYHQYRRRAGTYFKGPNVDQAFYDFLVRLPLLQSSIDPSTKPPMVISLHSRGGDFDRRERRWTDHIVVMPDDNTAGVGHTGWFGYHELAPERPKRDTVVVPYTERRLIHIIRFILAKYHVDPNRIWITGGSMGGGGALLFALRHPEWVVGAVAAKPPVDMRVLPALRPMAENIFGPMDWGLKVVGTDVSVWEYASASWLLSKQPASRTWLQIHHGRIDKVVPFQQYFTAISPPGRSFLQIFERGAAPGIFVWDMSGHGQRDRLRGWRTEFNPLAKGLIRMDGPTFVFSGPSVGHFGVPQQLGTWKGKQRPERHQRGIMNGFCRWATKDLVDRPDRLEVSLWLSDEGTDWQRCPAKEISYDVSPRGMLRFPIPPRCEFAYTAMPGGPSGKATSDEHGVLRIRQIPFRLGRDNAVCLRIKHAAPLPVVGIESPTHPTPLPRAPTSVVVRWSVANDLPGSPMPVDGYRCWISPKPCPPPKTNCETPESERVFESLEPGRYYVMVQARLVTGRWGPISTREVNVVNAM